MSESLRGARRRDKEEKEYQRNVDRAYGRDPDKRERTRKFLRKAGCDKFGRDLSH